MRFYEAIHDVYFDDLDALQILHNAKYLLLFERTIGSFWARVMGWERIRHVPVEDQDHRLVGVVTHRAVLRFIMDGGSARRTPVAEIMKRDVTTVTPATRTLEALQLMRKGEQMDPEDIPEKIIVEETVAAEAKTETKVTTDEKATDRKSVV